MKNIEPYTLFASFLNGKEEGFKYFFDTYYPSLCYYASRIIKDTAEAEDIVQESFIKLWKRRAQLDGNSNIKSLLYSIVRNACLDLIRHQRYVAVSENELSHMQGDTDGSNILHELIRTELLRELYNAIETLPAECRKVFKMIYIEGKNNRQIATELQLSESTIRNQKARGLDILKKLTPDFLLLTTVVLTNADFLK